MVEIYLMIGKGLFASCASLNNFKNEESAFYTNQKDMIHTYLESRSQECRTHEQIPLKKTYSNRECCLPIKKRKTRLGYELNNIWGSNNHMGQAESTDKIKNNTFVAETFDIRDEYQDINFSTISFTSNFKSPEIVEYIGIKFKIYANIVEFVSTCFNNIIDFYKLTGIEKITVPFINDLSHVDSLNEAVHKTIISIQQKSITYSPLDQEDNDFLKESYTDTHC